MLMALSSFIFLFCSLISLSLLFKSCNADDTHQLTFDETITPGESLVSPNQRFVLGFFSPSNYSNMSYLGIWYKKFPQVVVWVANRETPLTDSYGTLKIAKNGNLVLLNSTNSLIWSSNYSKPAQNSVLQLLDSGNLVLRENGNTNTESQIWQSFDFPGDTLLPGMKIGLDRTTGEARKLTSWKDFTDPSPGIFSYKMELLGLPQLVLRRGTKEKFRTGVWNGLRFSGRYISINSSTVYNYIYANNSREIYFSYEFTNNPTITRVTLNPAGLLKRYTYTEGSFDWELSYVTPGDNCDDYGFCGANGFCKSEKAPSCECLQGFIPKSLEEWNAIDGSGGCVRRTPLDCQKGDGFLKIKNVKLPDLLVREFWLNNSMNLKECETECLKNCNCTAYANSDISGRGSGCLIWFGDLIDTREFVAPGSEQDLYIRLAASELDHKRIKMVMFVAISTVAVILVLISFLIWHKIHKNKKRRETNREDREIPLFDLATMASATNNFSGAKMIGKGGFGSVYKGKLSTGQEIAVKRLSLQDSERGLQEFKNEMILISKLQHRNLVRLVGCCLEGKERLLVYEYMPNQSLDYFIFDKSKAVLLKWEYRLEIAMGIAKGLMYLHQDSRLRIIHRDLKASNVLLDSELNAKISDFGIARIFGGDQNEAKTKCVIGT